MSRVISNAMASVVHLSFYWASFLVLCCCCCCLTIQVHGQRIEVVEVPRNVNVARGGVASIHCAFRHPIHGCGWRINGTYVVPTHGRYEYEARIGLDGVQRCDIHISRVNADRDAGLWQCVTHRNETYMSIQMAPAKLTVIEALVRPADPIILFNQEEVKDELSQPELSSELVCVSRRASPSTRLHWEVISADDDDGGQTTRIPDDPKQFTTKRSQKISTELDGGDSDSSTLYDSFLWLDMIKHHDALARAKVIKCVARHPAYPGKGQRYVALLDDSQSVQNHGDMVPPAQQSEENKNNSNMLWYLWAIIGAVLILVILIGFLFHYAKKRRNHKVVLSYAKTKMTNGKPEIFLITGETSLDNVISQVDLTATADDADGNLRCPTPPFPPPPPPLPPSPSLKPHTLKRIS